MAGAGIHREQPLVFFKQLVDEAFEREKVDASEDSAFYLVRLLEGFVRPEGPYGDVGVRPEQPLGELLLLAARQRGARRFAMLKLAGDLALFLCGFFSDSLGRRLVDVDYYAHVGESAYGSAAHDCYPRSGAPLFEELAVKFVELADVLHHVSEQCALTDERNLLRIYERWAASGSRRSADILRRHGIPTVPFGTDTN